jgi:hypothetical protein
MSEEHELPTTKSIGIKYGLVSGLLGIIFFILIDVTGNAGNQTIQWLGLLITAAVVFLAHREYKNLGDGYMEYKQGVGIGAWIGLVGAIISNIVTYIYISFINTEYISFIRDQQRMAMEEQGMSDAQIDQAMDMSESFTSAEALVIFGLVFGVLFTVIIALIVAAITKNSRPELT